MVGEILTVFGQVLLDPVALGLSVMGVLFGMILGALPGVSSTMSLAVLLPVSFTMAPGHAMMFLLGIFSASVYGGSISAILINIPGTPGAIVTQMDGYPMARNGRAGEALTYALLARRYDLGPALGVRRSSRNRTRVLGTPAPALWTFVLVVIVMLPLLVAP